ncbi:MAG: M20 family metallopeptidase [Melioribacteraceae bacterium]
MKSIEDIIHEIIEIRRELHRNPEISFKEFNTTNLIEETLNSWELKFTRFKNILTGGYCEIGEGKVIAFRSDIDALPITEDSSHEICSEISGVMHACGHDFHTSIGLGLLKYFSENKNELQNKLRVIFQPAEEAAPGGAEIVVKENILENVKSIIAIHIDPTLEVGKFNIVEGPVQASSTSIHIEFIGAGGHTSKPSETVDLINVAAFYITQIQSFIQQKIDSRETVAFAFGTISGGSTHNIIPQNILLRGTLRTHNNEVLNKCFSLMKTFTNSFAELHKIKIDLQFPTNCPATINNSELTKKFIDFMKSEGNSEKLVLDSKPSMGADDFAFYGLHVPSLYLQVGAAGSGTLHSKDLVLNENLIQPSLKTMIGFIKKL